MSNGLREGGRHIIIQIEEYNVLQKKRKTK